MQWLKAIPLVGRFVTLEVLDLHHIDELKRAVLDGEPWKLWYANVPSPEHMRSYVQQAIIEAKNGNSAFAVRCNDTQKIVGTTRFYNVDVQNKRALLGYTWYAMAVRRSPVNTECKLLMLKYLFDTHNAIAVEFRTHLFNHDSRKAIERLGAKQDGILRSHQITKDGSIRDTVVYSIIASEWSTVQSHLLNKLKQA